ncbi:MAG TPA: cupin domain-containing protein [Thermoanaerobaculia bacterium]|nr:cupin domain-containing protein [Thermoanaerobaculia bacterium]
MKSIRSKTALLWVIAVGVGVAGIGALKAQQAAPAVKRTVLLRQDMTIPGREAVMTLVELPPGASEGRHTHPAEVYVFVQEGAISLEREGKPTESFKAGDVFSIAPGQIHNGTNKGTVPARLNPVFFAEKGKPLTTQVP